MAHVEKCPVCKGRGRLPLLVDMTAIAETGTEECHGCAGKGWVTVHEAAPIWMYPTKRKRSFTDADFPKDDEEDE